MQNTVKILSILSFFVLTQADVRHQTACNTVGSLKGIVDSVTELVDLAKERISTLEGVFSATTLERTFSPIVNDKQNRSFEQTLCVTQTTEQKPPLPEDCASIYKQQLNRTSGVYKIQPQFLNQSISVYCDMETSGGGWTLIQRRGDFGKPFENFYRSWIEYKNGFGNLTQEFWLGNDVIFSLTNQNNMVLRVDLEDFEGSRRYAEHDEFLVRSERELYKMSYKTYKGDAGKLFLDILFNTTIKQLTESPYLQSIRKQFCVINHLTMYNTVKILSILSFFELTQADVHHHTACNTVGTLKGIVDSVTELVDLARERISTLEDVFSTTTPERTFPSLVNDKQNRSVQESLCVTQTTEQKPPLPEDCASIYKQKLNRTSGVYKIQPRFMNQSIFVYCDMETSGGGWTLIQRRGDFGKPVENFYRSWVEYKNGFGNLTQEFWLGNDVIFSLTNQDSMVLRVDLEDFEGSRRYAEYDEFLVGSERELYKMNYKTYKGDAGNSLAHHNNMMFSTKDKDNDRNSGSCAQNHRGGWWYNSCHRCNLNGVYYTEDKVDTTGITWYDWKSKHSTLKTSEMKIRPVEFIIGQ